MPKWKVYRGQIIIAAMIARSSLFAYRFTRTAVRILNSTTWRANGPLGLYQVRIVSIVQYVVACAVLVTRGRRCFLYTFIHVCIDVTILAMRAPAVQSKVFNSFHFLSVTSFLASLLEISSLY
jgi:hypothetical protein